MSDMQFKYRPSEERGGANHGWLKTFHTFSFASWQDDEYENFGSLRVINEDRVEPNQGFPTHPHREFEIFSYIVSGALYHKDSMGNVETMKRGDVQMTSGGTGIKHSEYNGDDKDPVHFLQIWAQPNENRLAPKYYTRHFTDADKLDKWAHIVAPVKDKTVEVDDQREGTGPTPIHSPLHVHSAILSPSTTLPYTLRARHASRTWPHGLSFNKPLVNPREASEKGNKLLYVQLVQTSGYNTKPANKSTTGKAAVIRVVGDNGEKAVLGEGDGVFIENGVDGNSISVENVGGERAEVLVFEMDA